MASSAGSLAEGGGSERSSSDRVRRKGKMLRSPTMSSCAGMPFILKGTYLDGKDKFPIDSEKLNVEIEYSIHTLHSIIKRHCKNIFPDLIKSEDRKKSIGDLLCIPTFQHCSCDMLEFTDPAEKEKDKLLKSFYAWCQNLCARLIEDGYWADYIDPCSGKPVLGEAGSSTYNEVEGMQLLLRYRYQQVGMCKVILHPKWGQRIYPASMFTNAPLDIISKAILAMEETFKAPATSGTKNEESK